MDKDTLRSPGDQSVPAQRRRLLPVGTAKRWAGLQGDAPQEPARCPGPRFAPAPSRINIRTLLSTVLPVAGPVEPASRMPPPGRLPSAVSSPSAPTPSRSTTGAAFSSATSRWPSTPTSSPAPTTSRRIRRRCRPCWGRADRREVILWRGVERNWSPVRGPIPSPLPVLLPLEKGLGALAFVPDLAIKRLGLKPVPGLSRCGFFRPLSVPFWAGQKGDLPAGDTSRTAPENQEFVYVFCRTTQGKGKPAGFAPHRPLAPEDRLGGPPRAVPLSIWWSSSSTARFSWASWPSALAFGAFSTVMSGTAGLLSIFWFEP